MSRRLRGPVALALAALLLLTGCGADRPEPTLDFTVEQQGQSMVITIETTHFRIPGDGHAHIRLNDGGEAMAYSRVYTIPNIQPGTYKVFVELSDLKHRNLGVSKTKEFVVK